MSLKYRTSAGTSASDFTDLVVKVGDTLPIGSEIDYDGQTAPAGWQEIDDPNVYSTTEKRIGTWVDGKPLYRKCFEATTGSTANRDSIVADCTSLNIDNIVFLNGTISATGIKVPANYYYSSSNYGSLYYDNTAKKLLAFVTQYTSTQIQIILEYTKTTD